MMLFQVTYTMLPGQRDAFLQMMRESGILDQIRREEGCLDYRYYLPEEEDGTLLLVERWTGPRRPTWPPATWPGWARSRPSMWRRPAWSPGRWTERGPGEYAVK